MNHFENRELRKADIYQKLAGIDPQNKKNHVLKHVEIGFAAWQSLKGATEKKAVSEVFIQTFKLEWI